MSQWYKQTLLGVYLALLMVTMPAYAVEIFKVSEYQGGKQIWFEAEAYDERNPDNDQYYPVVNKDGAFGDKAINRNGRSGGMIRWTFDISRIKGRGRTWYFWGRVINPSNHSDYLLVEGDDKDIPKGPPFPGGDEVKPFVNADDRIFEQNAGPPWTWDGGAREGHIKDLQEGENTMYIFHRQGTNQVFWDVFVWADKSNYQPSDDDYKNAKEMKAVESVEPTSKLATVWGRLKSTR